MLNYRLQSDDGFMGNTHALSVAAVVLFFAAWTPNFFIKVSGFHNIIILLIALIVAMGAGLMPDLDNTTSSAISTLGPIGTLLSTIMRAISEWIYSFSHTNSEPNSTDPHRGFWHTAIAGIIMGICTMLLMGLHKPFLKLNHASFSIATVFLFIYLVIGFELAATGLLGKQIRQIRKNPINFAILWGMGIILAIALITLMPSVSSYAWVGEAVTIGWITHIVGDTLTTSGAPILWPLRHKNKRWWDYRLPPHIHANGPVEHKFFIPFFIVIIIICLGKIIMGG